MLCVCISFLKRWLTFRHHFRGQELRPRNILLHLFSLERFDEDTRVCKGGIVKVLEYVSSYNIIWKVNRLY